MKELRKILFGFIILALMLVVWHFSLAQSNVGVQGYVPETDLNRNVKSDLEIKLNQSQPIIKDNKYLYFFEKFWSEKESADKQGQVINHTKYDYVASYLLMAIILLILAILTFFVLRFIDGLFFGKRKKYGFKAHY